MPRHELVYTSGRKKIVVDFYQITEFTGVVDVNLKLRMSTFLELFGLQVASLALLSDRPLSFWYDVFYVDC